MPATFAGATAGFAALAIVDTVFGLSGAPAMFAVPAAVCVVVAAACVLVAAAAFEIVTTPRYEYVEVTGAGNDVGLYSDLGEPVTNIFAYGADGTLLENIRLYDQAGRPLDLGPSEPCYGGAFPEETFTTVNPWGTHVFPRLTVAVDEFGECLDPELQPPFGMALPGAPLK